MTDQQIFDLFEQYCGSVEKHKIAYGAFINFARALLKDDHERK